MEKPPIQNPTSTGTYNSNLGQVRPILSHKITPKVLALCAKPTLLSLAHLLLWRWLLPDASHAVHSGVYTCSHAAQSLGSDDWSRDGNVTHTAPSPRIHCDLSISEQSVSAVPL